MRILSEFRAQLSGRTWQMGLRLFLPTVLTMVAAHADVVFTNISGPNGGGGTVCGPASQCPLESLAEEFTPTGNYQVTSVEVVVGPSGTGNSDYFDASIYSNSSGLPGTSLGTSLAQSGASAGSVGITSGGVVGVDLTANTSYWLVLSPYSTNTQVYWSNGTGTAVPETYNPGSGWRTPGDVPGQFEIDGTPISAAPEPNQIGVLTLLLAVGLVVIRKRIRSSSRPDLQA